MGLTESTAAIARRYEKLAPRYRAIEALFALPPSIRRQAVDRMELASGDCVLESAAAAAEISSSSRSGSAPPAGWKASTCPPGMLARARRLIERRRWTNVEVSEGDAVDIDGQQRFDGVLFALSYSVIPHRDLALARSWEALVPGGRLTIMDACLPEGRRGRLLRPAAIAMSRATVLGDPEVKPWEELAALGPVATQRVGLGNYVIAMTRKPNPLGRRRWVRFAEGDPHPGGAGGVSPLMRPPPAW